MHVEVNDHMRQLREVELNSVENAALVGVLRKFKVTVLEGARVTMTHS